MNKPTKGKKMDEVSKTYHADVNTKNMLKIRQWNRRTRVIALVLFIFITGAGLYLYKTYASTVALATVEAEQLKLPTVGGFVLADSTASKGQAAELNQNGTATGSVNLISPITSITVSARGSQCQGSPIMNFVLDGKTVLTSQSITRTYWKTFTINLSSAAAQGVHSFSISFLNDYAGSYLNRKNKLLACDRNLFLDVINFYGEAVPSPVTPVPVTPAPEPAPVPAPTPTPTPTPPSSAITSGTLINASNTGLTAAGVVESSLVSTGNVTYSTDGQTITGKLFTGRVTVTGNNVTIKNCKVLGEGYDAGIYIYGDKATVSYNTMTSPANKDIYEPVYIADEADSVTVTRNDISRGENLLTTYGTNVTITENYMHDATAVSTGGHVDAIEVYGGGPTLIARNRILELKQDDAPINIAPYDNPGDGHPTRSVIGLSVLDNFLDGGSHIILIDNQSATGVIRNTRIERNVMGGHQFWSGDVNYGSYHSLLNSQNRAVVETESQLASNPNGILWPQSDAANANHWGESQDLTPNKNGQVVVPAY